jgi:hypothetical protein
MSTIKKPILLDETGKAIVEQLKQLNSNASGAADVDLSIVADEYSSKGTYAVGDLCLYKQEMYRCTTAITTGESWNADHWEKTSAGQEISGLAGDLAGLSFEKDSSGAWGYKVAGADTVVPFKQMDLLWSNSQATAGGKFTAQTISIPTLSTYKNVLIVTNYQTDGRKLYSGTLYDIPNVCVNMTNGADSQWSSCRQVTVNQTSIKFSGGKTLDTANASVVSGDEFCPPVAIYGIRSSKLINNN